MPADDAAGPGIERGDAIGAHAAMTSHLVHVELTLLQKQLGMSRKKPDKAERPEEEL